MVFHHKSIFFKCCSYGCRFIKETCLKKNMELVKIIHLELNLFVIPERLKEIAASRTLGSCSCQFRKCQHVLQVFVQTLLASSGQHGGEGGKQTMVITPTGCKKIKSTVLPVVSDFSLPAFALFVHRNCLHPPH